MFGMTAAGRWIGLAILLGYAADIASNFWLQSGIRLSSGPGSLLEGAAQQPDKIALIVALGLASGLISIGMGGLLCAVTRDRPTFALALTYLAVAAAALGLSGGELAGWQMMRALGQALADQPDGQAATQSESLQLMVSALRNGSHFPRILTGGFSAFLLYLLLLRAGFIPTAFGLLGLVAALAQMSGVFTGILGRDVHLGFLAPLFAIHLLLALWLLARGFRERPPPGETAMARSPHFPLR